MNILRSIAMAFSLFSILPTPRIAWEKGNFRYMLCAFPLIGVIIGLALVAWFCLCHALCFDGLLIAAGVCAIPALITGGIHLDGFCDTVDALASHADPVRKRAILKDPHSGAFAIVYVCIYFVLYLGFASQIDYSLQTMLLLGFSAVLSRCQSALASLIFPEPADITEGLTHAFRAGADIRRSIAVLAMLYLACATALLLVNRPIAVAIITVGLICTIYVYLMSKRQFGGMSGDIAGFFLQLTELAGCIAIVVAQGMMTL